MVWLLLLMTALQYRKHLIPACSHYNHFTKEKTPRTEIIFLGLYNQYFNRAGSKARTEANVLRPGVVHTFDPALQRQRQVNPL